MTTLRPYPEYKASGTDWIDRLPSEWATLRTKFVFNERVEKGYPEEPLLAATQTLGVVRKDRYENRTVVATKDLELLKLVVPGDFVISLRSFQGGIEVAWDRGIISPAYTVLTPTNPDSTGYLRWLLKSQPYIENLGLNVTGIREGQNINYESLARSPLPLPPLGEQRAIADFLDAMDERITRFIAARRRMIALLEEQKQAIINQSVTRGLDPDVPMKPSGIDWLGEIPAHWEVRSVGGLSSLIQTGPFGSQLHSSDYEDFGVPVINPSHIRDNMLIPDPTIAVSESSALRLARHQLQHGDIVMARRGEMGRCAVVREGSVGWICGTGSILIRPIAKLIDSDYLQLVLSRPALAAWLELTSAGATMSNLNTAMISQIKFPLPPVAVQQAIVRSATSSYYKIEGIAAKHLKEIDLMQEYRKRLISDVVTGKLDVRTASKEFEL